MAPLKAAEVTGALERRCVTNASSEEAAAALCGQTMGLYLLQEQALRGTLRISPWKPLAHQPGSPLLCQQPELVSLFPWGGIGWLSPVSCNSLSPLTVTR